MSAKKPRKVKERQKVEAKQREEGGGVVTEDEESSGDTASSGDESVELQTQDQDAKDASKAGESVLD